MPDPLILRADGWMISSGLHSDFHVGETRMLTAEARPLDLSDKGQDGLRHVSGCFYRGTGLMTESYDHAWLFDARGVSFYVDGQAPSFMRPGAVFGGAFSLHVAGEAGVIAAANGLAPRQLFRIIRISEATKFVNGLRLMENQRARPGRSLPSIESLLTYISGKAPLEEVPRTTADRQDSGAESYFLECELLPNPEEAETR